MKKENFISKTVLVVGGSSGIGWATARQAFELGAQVILTSRNKQRATIAAERIGRGVRPMEVDINDVGSVERLFEDISSLDHIYISAGSTRIGSMLDHSLEDSLSAFEERVFGSLRIVRNAIPIMNPGGSIVFTGGVSTDRPIAGAWVSGLGTSAAEQLARVLVMEFPHIRFNAISPGYTDTPMWEQVLGDNRQEVLSAVASKLPVKKIASPEDVAEAVIFLMGNQVITGEVLHIDGGGRLI